MTNTLQLNLTSTIDIFDISRIDISHISAETHLQSFDLM